MARSERRGVDLMQEMDTKFFDTLGRFWAMAEIQSAAFQVEHRAAPDFAPVAIIAEGVRYPINPE